MTDRRRSRPHRILLLVAGNLAVLALVLIVVEGVASYARVAWRISQNVDVADRRHTRYDPDLGWSNLPSVHVSDLYGPGIGLTTNARGFRGRNEISQGVDPGRIRIVCSGDSFTLGYGVSDGVAWCERLADIDPRIEPVNMGQGGYGSDQAYLWFLRDGRELGHRLHLFAFILGDFYRMQVESLMGHGKPVLLARDGALTVRNVPVPRASYTFPTLTANIPNLMELATLKFLRRTGVLRSPEQRSDDDASAADHETREVLRLLFEDLRDVNGAAGSELVLVLLASPADLVGERSPAWIKFLERASKELDIPLIDAFTPFAVLPERSRTAYFLQDEELPDPAAAGHFNELGHARTAEIVYEQLAARLGERQDPGTSLSDVD